MKRIIVNRVFTVLALWCVSALALADGIPGFPNFSQSSTDVSVKYLGEIFGHVPGVLNGSAGLGVMGQLFYVFNVSVMVVAATWLIYSIFNVVVSSSLQQQGFNSKHNFALISFRVVVGMALLVPNSTSGYSAVQEIMMKVVIEGTKLADETWNYALDYLANGGVIFTPIVSTSTLTPASVTQYKYMSATNARRPGTVLDQIFQDEVCMYASNAYNRKYKDTNQLAKSESAGLYSMIPVPPQVIQGGSFYHEILKPGSGQVNFPGYGDQVGMRFAGHNCGSITLPTHLGGVGGESQASFVYQHAYTALLQMALDIQPVAKALANEQINGETSDTMPAIAGGQHFMQSFIDYTTYVKPAAAFLLANSHTAQKEFITDAEAQGWFSAGSFYWNIARWNDSMNVQPDPAAYPPVVNVPSRALPKEIQQNISYTDNKLGTGAGMGMWLSGYGQIQSYIQQLYANSGAKAEGVKSQRTSREWSWKNMKKEPVQVPAFHAGSADYDGILSQALYHMVNTFQNLMLNQTANSYDPLVFVQTVGKSCLYQTGFLWSSSMSLATSWADQSGWCELLGGSFSKISVTMAWVLPLFSAVAASLFSAGFMLNFYVPLYPYLLFMFGAIGWLLYVLEAMVAAPLVCFGMTHPEGHDFMGKADQALMLALSVFLRPALMVIGFISGMLLSYVAFDFVNTVLGRVFISAFASSPTTANSTTNWAPLDAVWIVINGGVNRGETGSYSGNGLTDFLLIPLLLVAYGMIAVEVVNQCFSAIHQVPDMVLRWIGGPVQQDQSEKYAGAIKQGLTSASQQAGKLGGEGVSGAAKSKVAGRVDEMKNIKTAIGMAGGMVQCEEE
ncbi:MAG: DotA/TraY family protein [Coxiellaceae bacterium]|nr:DotA/TraY family protein [Coxiellaceae bacterium]